MPALRQLVTTLPAKAGSFSGHVCGNPLRFVPFATACPDKPLQNSEREDVLCGVKVAVGCIPTGGTGMHPIRERLFDLWKRTAVATHLRGVLRVNRDNSHPSFFRFGCEDVKEPRPSRIMGALGKTAAGDAFDVKRFVGDQAVLIYQLAGLFVVEVPSLVGRLLVQLRYAPERFAAAVGAFLFSREAALCPSKFLLSLPVVARRFYELTIRGNKK
jgi:hypothetical protein